MQEFEKLKRRIVAATKNKSPTIALNVHDVQRLIEEIDKALLTPSPVATKNIVIPVNRVIQDNIKADGGTF